MQQHLCQRVSRCSSKFFTLCSFNKPGLPLLSGVNSISVPRTRQAPPAVVLLGSRSAASRAASAIRSTLIHQVGSEGFSQLQSPRITLVGNIVRDVEVKQINTRKGPMNLGVTTLAVNQEDASVLWVKLNFWRDSAYPAAESLKKGMKVEVFGVVRQNSYTRRDGTPGHSTEVTVMSVRQVESNKKQQPSFSGPFKPTMGAGSLYIDEEQENFD